LRLSFDQRESSLDCRAEEWEEVAFSGVLFTAVVPSSGASQAGAIGDRLLANIGYTMNCRKDERFGSIQSESLSYVLSGFSGPKISNFEIPLFESGIECVLLQESDSQKRIAIHKSP
jgi:hypothetical protein